MKPMDEPQRGMPLPDGVDSWDVFVLDPANDDFVAGAAPLPATWRVPRVGQRWMLLILIAIHILVAPFGIAWKEFGLPEWLGVTLLYESFGAILIYLVFSQFVESRIARENRQLLAGTVLRCDVWKRNADFLSINFAFASPSGKRLSATEPMLRRRGKFGQKGALPETGDTVLVLYVDDRHYRLL